MPALSQLQGSLTPVLTQVINSNPVVEPLDGPTIVEDIFDRFPEEVYQQGRDTHLYRLLSALCGDAGAGLLKTQAYTARLQYEAELISGSNLNSIYAQQFQIYRLADETYSYDPTATLTPLQADAVALADQSYYHRGQEFFTATRSGNSPAGIATMAQAGSGIISDVVENYKYIFDQYSDAALGLSAYGSTLSTSEFIILVRFLGQNTDRSWDTNMWWEYIFTPPTLTTGSGRPVPLPTGSNVMSVSKTLELSSVTELLPEIERNVVDVLDRLRPASTLATIAPEDYNYTTISLNAPVFASSERLLMSRFVTGSPNVSWPGVDPSAGYFIEANVENEAAAYQGTYPELSVIFHTISSVLSYTESALLDPLYGEDSFYVSQQSFAPVDQYVSEHVGVFFQTLVNIFPSLANVSYNTQFYPINALAPQDTSLKVRGPAIA